MACLAESGTGAADARKAKRQNPKDIGKRTARIVLDCMLANLAKKGLEFILCPHQKGDSWQLMGKKVSRQCRMLAWSIRLLKRLPSNLGDGGRFFSWAYCCSCWGRFL